MNVLVTEKSKELIHLKEEANNELKSILQWWIDHSIDVEQGGFFGSIDNNNIPALSAPKGIVLNSRILWSFSAAYLHTPVILYRQTATRAFEYILKYFADNEFGGVFWSVDQDGKMLDARKQIYGLAFCIYGMSEYFKVSGDEDALKTAKSLYQNIEKYSFDINKGGYIEAFSRDWKLIDNLRLSEKDDNEKKTMNTHLHIIEAYANLYTVWPEKTLRDKIAGLLEIFDTYFINKDNYHLNLFFDENWNPKSSLLSFGHDIEAAWLLLQCAETINEKKYVDRYKKLAIPVTDAAAGGLDADGGLWYEYQPEMNHWIREKHSWPQAEAIIGFLNAYQLTRKNKYLQLALQSWNFIKNFIKDNNKGEWFWGIDEDGFVMNKEKAGFWKCPYHSVRACLEIYKRISLTS